MQIVFTTTRRPQPGDEHRARRYAAALQAPFLARNGASFPEILAQGSTVSGQVCAAIVIVSGRNVSIWTEHGMLNYHPGMALHRVAGLRRGEQDTMINAMQLQAGDAVLDCTAGLASDAVVAAHVVGASGRVLALESIGALALLLKTGLKNYPGQGPELTAAMRRVKVRHCRHEGYLRSCPNGSFDVVYFDPMFTHPVEGSTGIAPLRPLADYSPVTAETLDQAKRVARRVVVLKDRSDGPYTQQYAWDDIQGGRHSRITYCRLFAESSGGEARCRV